jgi:hypothetical protein
LKLPTCVLTGVHNLFPYPDAKYTGHRELEWMKTVAYVCTVKGRRLIMFITIYSTSYVNYMSHRVLAPYVCGNLESEIRNKSDPEVKYWFQKSGYEHTKRGQKESYKWACMDPTLNVNTRRTYQMDNGYVRMRTMRTFLILFPTAVFRVG